MVEWTGKAALLLIMDGLGELPSTSSALYKAKKPHIDALARDGIQGVMHVLGRGLVPGSDTAHLTLFGYNIKTEYPDRGPLEALGVGIKLKKGDVAFRTNFATLKAGKIVDRRAGRIPTSEARKLAKLLQGITIDGVEFIFHSTVEHRGALVMRGKGLSPDISDSDPHDVGVPPKPFKGNKRMVKLLNAYIKEVNKRLRGKRANTILIRGAGMYKPIQSFEEKHRLSAEAVAGGALYKGVARYLGMETPDIKGATGDAHSDYSAKARAAIKAAKAGKKFVFLHVKATDSFSHDGNCKGKRSIVERVDREIVKAVKPYFDPIVITGDHATPCSLGRHTGHGVPFLAYGSQVGRDNQKKFAELYSHNGGLGHFYGKEVMPQIINWMGLAHKIGE